MDQSPQLDLDDDRRSMPLFLSTRAAPPRGPARPSSLLHVQCPDHPGAHGVAVHSCAARLFTAPFSMRRRGQLTKNPFFVDEKIDPL